MKAKPTKKYYYDISRRVAECFRFHMEPSIDARGNLFVVCKECGSVIKLMNPDVPTQNMVRKLKKTEDDAAQWKSIALMKAECEQGLINKIKILEGEIKKLLEDKAVLLVRTSVARSRFMKLQRQINTLAKEPRKENEP